LRFPFSILPAVYRQLPVLLPLLQQSPSR